MLVSFTDSMTLQSSTNGCILHNCENLQTLAKKEKGAGAVNISLIRSLTKTERERKKESICKVYAHSKYK